MAYSGSVLGDVSQILLTLSVVVMSDVGVAFGVELCAVDFDAGRGMSAAAVVEAEDLLRPCPRCHEKR